VLVRETGTVVGVEGDLASVRIRHERTPSCGGCTACKPAGGGAFVLRVARGNLREGDRVALEIPVPSPWRAVLAVFAIPLAALLVGVVAGSLWTGFQDATGLDADGAAVALGLAMVAAAFVAALAAEARHNRRHPPRVLEVLPPQ
jgi:positive regulator of sigma E activity